MLKLKIKSMMTPQEILKGESFEKPHVITPKMYPTFDDIAKYREEVRTLKLVPVKNDEIHDKYNSLNKEHLAEDIAALLKDFSIVIKQNEFPYWLPEDVDQKLVWIKSDAAEYDVVSTIADHVRGLGLTEDDVIIFERPLGTKSLLVKGTFPHYRHIHLWTKIKTI